MAQIVASVLACVVATVRESLVQTIAIMVIIAASAPFAWILVADQVPLSRNEKITVKLLSPDAK